jgi:AbiJ N-terminal domain 4
MLTHIFAERYANRVIWPAYWEAEKKLLMQCYRMVEDLFPYWVDGKVAKGAEKQWKSIHNRLSMELGLGDLGPLTYQYQLNGQTLTGWSTLDQVCKNFVTAPYDGTVTPDRFIKDRLSFVELAFRLRGEELDEMNAQRGEKDAAANLADAFNAHKKVFTSAADGVKRYYESVNANFRQSVEELNERLRRAGAKLNYHNGFIQIASDELVEAHIEKPFWALVADPLWKNVDIDMKEAVDRRDAKDRDPAWYAARALESAIKIISDQKGWTHGRENGAYNYIENLRSKKNGSFINDWEEKALKDFFTSVRNPFGHGPGSAEMPELSPMQTDWALERCMSWAKALIERM